MRDTGIIIGTGVVCQSAFTPFGVTVEVGSPVLGNRWLLITCKR